MADTAALLALADGQEAVERKLERAAASRRTVLSPSRPQANGLRALNIDIAVVFPPGSGVTAGGVALGPYPPLVFHAPYSTNQGLVSRREEV